MAGRELPRVWASVCGWNGEGKTATVGGGNCKAKGSGTRAEEGVSAEEQKQVANEKKKGSVFGGSQGGAIKD